MNRARFEVKTMPLRGVACKFAERAATRVLYLLLQGPAARCVLRFVTQHD